MLMAIDGVVEYPWLFDRLRCVFDLKLAQYGKTGWRRASETKVAGATAFNPHSGRARLDDRAGCARALASIEL